MGRRKRRRRRDAVTAPVGDLVGGVLDKYRVRPNARRERVLIDWTGIVGERIAQRAYPIDMRNGVLVLAVKNSSWMHQLTFLKSDLLAKVNQALGGSELSEVRLELAGRKPTQRSSVDPRIRRAPPRAATRPLPEPAEGERLDEIRRESEAVEDDELREIIVEARRKLDL